MLMSKQDVFNKVSTHLLKQKEVASNMRGCAYRGIKRNEITDPDGNLSFVDVCLKCAVGCLIPDSIYEPRMEGRGVDWLLKEYPKFKEQFQCEVIWNKGYVYDDSKDILTALQYVHDCRKVQEWKQELSAVAVVFGVSGHILNSL